MEKISKSTGSFAGHWAIRIFFFILNTAYYILYTDYMEIHLSHLKSSIETIIEQLKEDLKTFRTGRANPTMIEYLLVDAYGGQTKMKLLEMATILTEGPTTLVISPFDPATLSDIEKAILKSPIGLSPQIQGNRIILKIPLLSQEQREKLIKLCHMKIEEKRNTIRNIRDEVRKKIKTMFEAKEITEDDKFRTEKEIDTVTQKYMEHIEAVKDKKDREISEI